MPLLLFSCAESSVKENTKSPEKSDIGIKNSSEVDSLSLKLKEIEALIDANDKVIESLND